MLRRILSPARDNASAYAFGEKDWIASTASGTTTLTSAQTRTAAKSGKRHFLSSIRVATAANVSDLVSQPRPCTNQYSVPTIISVTMSIGTAATVAALKS